MEYEDICLFQEEIEKLNREGEKDDGSSSEIARLKRLLLLQASILLHTCMVII